MCAVARFAIASLALLSHYAFAGGDVLSPRGYGVVRFGMNIQEAELKLRQKATEPYSGKGCDYIEFKKYPGLRFMVEDGVITRADARKDVRNSAKVRVGTSLDRIKAMHPHIEVEPHKYDDEGHYLILNTDDGHAALVFEESKGKVTDVRGGLKPAVEYVEGCL